MKPVFGPLIQINAPKKLKWENMDEQQKRDLSFRMDLIVFNCTTALPLCNCSSYVQISIHLDKKY